MYEMIDMMGTCSCEAHVDSNRITICSFLFNEKAGSLTQRPLSTAYIEIPLNGRNAPILLFGSAREVIALSVCAELAFP